MDAIERHRKRVLERADISRRPGDGEWVYWPSGTGCYSAADLNVIANEIDRLNKIDDDNEAVREGE